MKSIYFYLFLIGIFISSCDKGFEELNKNPTMSVSLDPAYLFAQAQLSSTRNAAQYQDAIVQQLVCPFGSSWEGGNHNIWFENTGDNGIFGAFYATPVKLLTDVIDKTKNTPSSSNLYNMARIWKAYLFQVLVDTYGDVPYFQAGQAFLNGIFLPPYDPAETIYTDLLKELSEATVALDASKVVIKNDLFYKGDIATWKKLGNSLLLRVAMRYTKVDPSKAKEYVAIATNPANGGLINSNAANAMIILNSNFTSPYSGIFIGSEQSNFYLAKPFVDYLKNTNDPRLKVISVLYDFPANPLSTVGYANTNPADQIGMPMGYDNVSISTAPDYPGKTGSAWKYSQGNRSTIGKINAPYFFVTYSQTQLLLAEAVQRGWVSGNVSALYNAAVKGHMDQMAIYDLSATISSSDQDAYLAANPLVASTALEQINSQYWVSSFLESKEGWANFRRSGFPALVPNPYPGADPVVKDGFIRRLIFPSRERAVNAANYEVVVARMGPDNLATSIFWDKL